MFEFDVLGPLRVSRDGVPVPLGAAMLRRVLAALLCTPGRPVAVPALIEALWGSTPPRSAHKTLQIYVLRLRQALGERDRVVHCTGGYAATVLPPELDALRFRELAAAGRAAGRNADLAKAGMLFERALGLWRGPAYADIGDVATVADEARRLDEERLLTCEELAVVDLARGRHAELITGLTEMAESHPYRERLQACLMLALSRAGRQVEALRVYQRTRAVLGEELGVEPGRSLRRVHEAILRDEANGPFAGELLGPEGTARADERAAYLEAPATAGDEADRGCTDPATTVPCHLPPDIADFTGRQDTAESLRLWLTGADGHTAATPVVALWGGAGTGKTTLAVHVAHRLGETFSGGTLYIDLRGTCPRPTAPAEALTRFLIALGVDERAVPDEAEERGKLFRTVLADRRVLVVLDDAAGEEQVRPLLPGGAGCAVLVTSRRGVAGLSARSVRVGPLDPACASELLGRIAGPVRVAARPTVAAEIVRLCGHLPLAIRIAGAKLALREHWRLDHLADRLRAERGRLDELTLGDLSVRAGLAADYDRLDETTRRALRMLGLLDVPAFAAWMLAAALDVTVREAEAYADLLVDAQLLSCEGSDGNGWFRYRFPELARLYARERAELEEPAGERDKAITRVLGALLALAEAAESGLPEQVASGIRGAAPRWYADPATTRALVADPAAWFDSERQTLLAGVAQACRLGLHEAAWELSARAAGYYAFRGHYRDWAFSHELALRACALGGDQWGEAVMTRGLGHLLMVGVEPRRGVAPEAIEAALAAFGAAGERHGALDLLCLRAFALCRGGDPDQARAVADEAMAMAEEIGYELALSRLWYVRAVTDREQGLHGDALACADRALRLAIRGNSLVARTLALREMAAACRDHATGRRVSHHLWEGLQICRRRGERLLEAYLLVALGDLCLRFGRRNVAKPIERALAVFEEFGVRAGQAAGLRVLGESQRLGGRADQAVRTLGDAVRTARGLHDLHEQALALRALGRAQHARGDQEAATRSRTAARRLFQRLGDTAEAAEAAVGEALTDHDNLRMTTPSTSLTGR
ncbi:AfsR/SARP family transcriptional regulator [Microbispora sp. KK1-11]|uniref:AfsR/SARP family transcriptional regulator n=1 Tax=Microbispora sp. KK1-11 TaxID=2053005 RepID=UPI0011587FCD|nr:AfsR/SARP family transcriptional regulator [Microbispora sp. KK1-11]TQS20149.1 AfsR family transcriptional regulator [Microbispora sp. KK1-11]